MTAARVYYPCSPCHHGHCPFDRANQLRDDRLSTGLRPLVGLAGVLESFRGGGADIRRRCRGVRLSARSTRHAPQQTGDELARRPGHGAIVTPRPAVAWDFRVEGHSHTVADRGRDAFSVPIQQPDGPRAESRMLDTAILYTPDKSRSHSLVDFDLDRLAGQMRRAATALGLGAADPVRAMSDAGHGIAAALQRHFGDALLCILDWSHACQHRHGYAKCLHPKDTAQATAWAKAAKDLLYEKGGTALLSHGRGQEASGDEDAAAELRKRINYFADNEPRTDYPEYRKHGWAIGSGPPEAAGKVVGARRKGSGMRGVAEGAATGAPLRALYRSGANAWDTFWAAAA